MQESFQGPEQEVDIFNLQPESFVNAPKKKSLDTYEPAADKGRDGVYSAIVRFLPNWKSPTNSKIHKFRVWLQDPTEEKGFYVDCPSSVNKPSVLKDLFWKLKKSSSAREQELADNFSRADTYYSLVQIIEDTNQPDLVGKIMVFRYGTKINQKIESLLKPTRGAACNPFDLFEGKEFELKITKKQKWNNYDLCEFIGERCPLILDGKPIQKTQEDMDKVRTWLKDNSPELDRFEFREWDEDLTAKVNKAILNIVPDGSKVVEGLLKNASQHSSTSEDAGFSVTVKHSEKSAPKEETLEEHAASSVVSSKREEKPKTTAKASSVEDLYDDL